MSPSDARSAMPALQLTDNGFIAPTEADILAAVQADINAALGGAANMALDTPQGQIAMTMAAVIADCHDQLISLLNGFDPATASGQMQDAIGLLYFMKRRPSSPTRVEAVLRGTALLTIKAGSRVATDGRYVYVNETDLTFDDNGEVTSWLSCETEGAISCPPSALRVYAGASGLVSVSNANAGTTGQDVEGRREFERRRQQILSSNASGTNAALLGALLDLDGVTDAWVTDNPSDEDVSLGRLTLPAHHLFICVAGGGAEDIGQVILRKKPPGCPISGAEKVTVTDRHQAYKARRPSYEFSFSRPEDVAVKVNVTLLRNSAIPSDAVARVRQAVISTLSSGEADARLRIGGNVLSSQFYPSVASLGRWAQIVDISLTLRGTTQIVSNDPTFLSMEVYQLPSIREEDITLTLTDGGDA